MGMNTEISWTNHTFNPWWGCTRVSPGCEHCYAEVWAKRTGLAWGPRAERRLFGDKHWREPFRWNAAAEKEGVRRLVFCASMADVFEDRPELEAERLKLWQVIEATPALTWQLLTKRPENAVRMTPSSWTDGWPRNVWAMTTAEDQRRAEERIPWLLQIPAVVRGVSYEPALGPVNFRHLDCDRVGGDLCQVDSLTGRHTDMGRPCPGVASVTWIIIGGESGPHRRPFDLAWLRSTVEQCRDANVPVFVKQDSGPHPGMQGRIPAELWVKELPT